MKALVFRGSGNCKACSVDAGALLQDKYEIVYVGPKAKNAPPLTQELLNSAAVWIQPGDNGSDVKANKDFSPEEHQLLNAWVKAGGRYVGFCMGAYLAGSKPGFGFLPGSIDSYVGQAEVKSTKDQNIDIHWESNKIYEDRSIFYQDGPFFDKKHVPDGAQVLGTYKNGSIAAMVFPYGAGKVAVCGPHPEATKDWGKHAPDNRDLGYDLIAHLLA